MAISPETPALTVPELSISTEQVCFVVVKARQLDVKDAVTIPDSASNASDDHMVAVLEDTPDDPTRQELAAFIRALDQDARIDLVSLAWVGRGDGTIAEWDEVRGEAARAYTATTIVDYLLGMPLLADFLEEGLSQFGRSCQDDEAGRL